MSYRAVAGCREEALDYLKEYAEGLWGGEFVNVELVSEEPLDAMLISINWQVDNG